MTPLPMHDKPSIKRLQEEVALAAFDGEQTFEAFGDGLLEPAAFKVALKVLQCHGYWVIDEYELHEIGYESLLLGRVRESGTGLSVTLLKLQTCREGFRPFEDLMPVHVHIAGQAYFNAGNVKVK